MTLRQLKKIPSIAMFIAVITFSLLTLSTTPTFASNHLHPIVHHVSFLCPKTKFDPGNVGNVLVNDGTTISGTGEEFIDGHTTLPFKPPFSTPKPNQNIPDDLKDGNYYRSATSYLASTGTVTCHYTSSAGFAPFTVSYTMQNGRNATIHASTVNYIALHINFFLKGPQ